MVRRPRHGEFKTPEKVERLDHLPLLGSGKPDRAALQRRAAARLTPTAAIPRIPRRAAARTSFGACPAAI